MYSMPFENDRQIDQPEKPESRLPCREEPAFQPGASVAISVLMASPPIQVWMPNHPQATSARSTAATFAPSTPNDARASTGNGIPYFAPGMRVQQHRNQHDHVAEKHRGMACFQFIPPWIRLAASM